MKKIFLIAETPRAGNLGHRFLVSPQTPCQPAQIAAYCEQASKQATGKNYLAASQTVEQHMANGSIRQGKELLILHGLQTEKMTEQERANLARELKSLFPLLQELVRKEITWQKADQQLCLELQELGDWKREKLSALALFCNRQRKRKRIFGLVAGISVFLGAAFFLALQTP